MAHPPPSESTAPSPDRWLPASLADAPALVVRQARAVVALAGLTMFSYAGVGVAFWLGGLEAQAGAAAATAVAACIAVLLVRLGQVQVAAFTVSLTLAVAPVVQASLDAGVRDPALALAVLAPLAAAMVLDTRTAVATVGVIAVGVGALLVLDLMDMVVPSAASSDTLAGYTVLAVLSGAAFSVLAGALYERHTREVIDAVEDRAGRLGEALQESEDRYRTLVDEVPIGIYRTALDGRVLLANQHLARMLGVGGQDEALTLNSATFYDDPHAQERLRDVLDREGSVRRYPARWRTPAGDILSVRVDARAVRGEDGTMLYYEGVVEDVTAEVLAQAAVKKSEARFRALVQRSSDVTVILDHTGHLTYVSPSVQSLLGYELADLEGRAMVDFIHPDEREPLMQKLSEPASEVISSPPVEVRLLHAEGHYLYAEGVGTSLFEDPAVGGFVVNLRDVTERHRARGALIHAKRQAEELSQLKSTFLSNMSHEIRTPLTAILGFTDILNDEVTDERASEFVGLVAESGHRLLEMLNAILDLARMDAGQGHFVPEPHRMESLVREVTEHHRAEVETKGLTLAFDEGSEPLLATLDSSAFKKALHHVIGNAIKFTDEGTITVGLRTNGDEVLVHVRDTGRGIDSDFLAHLFTPFEQESTGAERTHEGAGLGLAIVHQLVERMGGQVKVQSRKGVGSLFTLVFPRTQLSQASGLGVSPARPSRPDTDRPRALVSDDDEASRFVAENALKTWYDVETADSAKAALAIADGSFDLFIQDIYMGPEGSGEDVVRELRRRPETKHTPIIAVTAYGLPGDRSRLLAVGFDGYLRKPYTQAQMRAEVTAAIQARTGQSVSFPAKAPALLVRNRRFGEGGGASNTPEMPLPSDVDAGTDSVSDRPVWN
ncbi:MAG: hypothetical protein Rubg2KO_12060 [Rubricoccaceae bacterium]